MKTTLRTRTPNALPPTMLTLGERFGNASISAKVARDIISIDSLTIGDYKKGAERENGKYPYHMVDIWYRDAQGDDNILVRSKELRINQRQLRTFMREVTRKVAVFIFENKG